MSENSELDNSYLIIENISKSFGSTRALDGVSLEVSRPQVFGLAGENGAGKSTLIKILCGVYNPDSGEVHLDGRLHHPRNPEEAEQAGISVFHQEIPICPNLSIAANVFLGPSMPRKGMAPDWTAMNRQCVELYETLLGEDIDPRRLIRDCTAAEKQMALLVRVLSRNARLIILDEPTTALTPPEVARLFGIIRRLQEQEITFIFISHMLEELIELSDTISVLRDGHNVGSLNKEQFDRRVLSEMIAERTLAARTGRGDQRESRELIAVHELGVPGEFEGVSFRVGQGEIFGLAGLQGSGRSGLARSLFGSPPAESGEILIEGRSTRIRNPRDAIAAGKPISFQLSFFMDLFGRAEIFGVVPVPVLWMLAWGVLIFMVLHRTTFGIKVFATGDNREAADLAGIRTMRIKRICFLGTSLAAAVSAIISLSFLKTVTPTQGTGIELEAIAAAVIGGTAMSGGVGSILGTFIGTFIMAEVRTGLVLLGTDAYVQDAFVGLVIAVAVIINVRLSVRRK